MLNSNKSFNRNFSLIQVGIVLVFLGILTAFGFSIFMGVSMYEACLEEGKSKSVCMRDTYREVGQRGHNLSIENR